MASEQQDVRARLWEAVKRDRIGPLVLVSRDDLAALLAPAPGVPEGLRLVPVEPTPEMVRAYWGGVIEMDWHGQCAESWSAMLAAAPAPAPIPAAADTAALVEHRPQITDPRWGAEPSVRELARFYYAQHGEGEPDAVAAEYVAALAQHRAQPASDEVSG